MRKWWTFMCGALGGALAASLVQSTVLPVLQGAPAKTVLQPSDYMAIEALYSRNTIGYDSAAEQGEMFAGTFVADGVLRRPSGRVVGHEALAALAASNSSALRHWISNLLIEPVAGGATGVAYIIEANVSAKGDLVEGGLYQDELVKTPAGWRFKARTYTPGHRLPGVTSIPENHR